MGMGKFPQIFCEVGVGWAGQELGTVLPQGGVWAETWGLGTENTGRGQSRLGGLQAGPSQG